MSFASNQYIKWAESQFEQTGIAANDIQRTGGIAAVRKYKRDAILNTPEAIEAYKAIIEWDCNNRFGIQTPQDIEQEQRIDEYIKDCETMGNDAAKAKYLTPNT